MPRPAYVLGHSQFELERLARQERLIGGATRDYFRVAGIAPGMRVLDVGSGTGAVAFHAAEFVGSTGEVIGTDLAPAAIEAASQAAAARGLSQVSFRQGNPAEMTFERPFDAAGSSCFTNRTGAWCGPSRRRRPTTAAAVGSSTPSSAPRPAPTPAPGCAGISSRPASVRRPCVCKP
jgi:SAM-dependent methyltransferase